MKQLVEGLRQDRLAYARLGKWYGFPGFWLVAIYRFGMWAKRLPHGPRQVAWLLYRLLHLPYPLFNVVLWAGPGGCEIGPGLCLIHPNNIYFGPGVRIGRNCLVHHEVTLGMGSVPGTPQLGDNVVLYPGVRVQGGIRIGDNVLVGANCVVTRHIAPGSVVAPAPVRIIPRALSGAAREFDTPATRPPSAD